MGRDARPLGRHPTAARAGTSGLVAAFVEVDILTCLPPLAEAALILARLV